MADEDAGADKPKKEEATSATAVADEVLTSEITGSASSYRRLGEIFVSLLAAVPAAGLVTTLVRAPGEAGLDERKLGIGLALAVVAVMLGLILALRMRAPVEVDESSLHKFPMSQIVETQQTSYGELIARIRETDKAAADPEETPEERARLEQDRDELLKTLRSVHLLQTAKELRGRALGKGAFLTTLGALLAAAGAVFFLALAPRGKAGTPVQVVQVKLAESEAAKELGCSASTFHALEIGGEGDVHQVVPLGGASCTAGPVIEVKVEDEGSATAVEPVDAASD